MGVRDGPHRPEPEGTVRRGRVGSLVLAVALGHPLLGLLLGVGDRPARAFAGPAAEARSTLADDGDIPATPSSVSVQNAVPPSGETITPSKAADAQSSPSAACDLHTATPTATITLGDVGVSAPCIMEGAGDQVIWVNPTTAPIAIHSDDDQFYTEDVRTSFSTVEVPARGQIRVRLIHAGRVVSAAPDHPGIGGTILVLGHGAA